MLKLTRKLLQGIANALTRYASLIEKRLAQENLSVNRSISDYSDERPPAHWLAKVRQGAPHLLDNHSGDDTQTVSFSSETKNTPLFNSPASNNLSEKPPAQWIEKVRRGAPHLLDEQPVYEKNTSKHFTAHEQVLSQKPGGQEAINEGNSDHEEITAKQSDDSETKPEEDFRLSGHSPESTWHSPFDNTEINNRNLETQYNKRRLSDSSDQTIEHNYGKAEKPFSNNKSSTVSEKKIAITKTELKETDQTRLSARYTKVKPEVSSNNRQPRMLRLNAIILDASTLNNKQQRRSNASHEQFTKISRMWIKRDPYEKSRAAQQFQNMTAEPRNTASINTLKQHGVNETTALNPDNTTPSSYLHKPSEQLNLNWQRNDKHWSKEIDTAAADISFGSNHRQYTARIPKTAEPFESGIPRWPNLPGEKERRLPDDQWPELPAEKMPDPNKMIQQTINFAQLQKAIERNHQSELEQRGMFWNG